MPSAREIVYAVYGAWLLLRFEARGLTYFKDSVPAFWRSFFAAVIVAPAYLVMTVTHLAKSQTEAGLLQALAVELPAYVILWTAFPLALFYITRGIGKEDRFLIAVIALNWTAIIHVALSLPVHLVTQAQLLPPPIGDLLGLGLFVFLLIYEWFIVRTALTVGGLVAAGVVFLDVFLSFAIRAAADGMLQ
jgi:hypothetical protein